MGLINTIFQAMKNKKQVKSYTRMLNGEIPVFSNFGQNIYSSDLVKSAIRSIAREISKVQIASVLKKKESINEVTVLDDNLNSIFDCVANPFMTMPDFLEKIIWILELNMNVFIYPTFRYIIGKNGTKQKEYTGFYPLDPVMVEFIQDLSGTIFVRFTDKDGMVSPEIKYSEVIHIRKDYSLNYYFGGNENGQADNREILKILEANNKMIEGIGAAIETSLKMKGIITAKSVIDEVKIKKAREKFEKQFLDSNSGLVATDLAVDVTPFNIEPAKIESSTMEFIEKKIFRNHGVSVAIVNGTASDNEKNLFYQQTLEPILNKISYSFSKVLFTQKEREEGHKIMCFYNLLQSASLETKIKFTDISSNIGLNKVNELRNLFGYMPVVGGEVRIQSLNYIDSDIASTYQLSKTKKSEEGGNIDV